jgi:hypothetical protein
MLNTLFEQGEWRKVAVGVVVKRAVTVAKLGRGVYVPVISQHSLVVVATSACAHGG